MALLLQVVQVFFISSTKSQGDIFYCSVPFKKKNHIAKAVGKTSGSPTELAREGFKTRGDGSISKVFAEQAWEPAFDPQSLHKICKHANMHL